MANEVIQDSVKNKDSEGWYRVGAHVEWQPVWFETQDAPLDASPEAVASGVLLPATAWRRRLRIADPVSREWRTNVARLMDIWREWWRHPAILPDVSELPAPRPRSDGALLCFSGGVDSFHTLLCSKLRPSLVVFVHGFDIPLDDHVRMAEWEKGFRASAAAVGAHAVLLRSNLRTHVVVRSLPWDFAHGGALAAVGHLFAPQYGTLLIASTYPTYHNLKCGSHWMLDPLWSSDRLRIIHHGAECTRGDKVRAIVDHELAQRFLRVCFENREPSGNCSRCDKCLCTMALIARWGDPGKFRGFQWPASLEDTLERLPSTRYVLTYKDLICQGVSRRMEKALCELVLRSPYAHAPVETRRRVRAWFARRLQSRRN